MAAYALTIFVGAFLLFQVEPIIGKYILPWFGGSPGVWTTCLLFFQTLLLVGYAYAHLTSRFLRPRWQAALHGALLLTALALLPIIPGGSWKPAGGSGSPTWQILLLLLANLGLPFLVLAATGPLIQEWCRQTHPSQTPYRLYALSNAGSFLALVSYPFFFEWMFPRRVQAALWGWGLAVFTALCGFCCLRLARSARIAASGPEEDLGQAPAARESDPLGRSSCSRLHSSPRDHQQALPGFGGCSPFCGSSRSGFISSVSSSASIARSGTRGFWSMVAVAGTAGIVKVLFVEDEAGLGVQVAVYAGALFAGCMVCHGELYRLRPDPRRLTAYYLWIAAGGALGGVLVAVVAPRLFHSFAELPLGYWLLTAAIAVLAFRDRHRSLAAGVLAGTLAALFLVPLLSVVPSHDPLHWVRSGWEQIGRFGAQFHWEIPLLLAAAWAAYFDRRKGIVGSWTLRSGLFVVAMSGLLGAAFALQARRDAEDEISASRSFFGVLTVFDYDREDALGHYYLLLHGKIVHGLQFTNPIRARWPTTYYAETSGVGRAISSLPRGRPRRLGLVGLGTGTLAAYARPAATSCGSTRSTRRSRPSRGPASPTSRSARPGSGLFPVTPASRWSGNSREGSRRVSICLPSTLSTATRSRSISSRSRPLPSISGTSSRTDLAVHISNKYFDLEPVVDRLAGRFGLASVTVEDDAGEDQWWIYDSDWMLLSAIPGSSRFRGSPRPPSPRSGGGRPALDRRLHEPLPGAALAGNGSVAAAPVPNAPGFKVPRSLATAAALRRSRPGAGRGRAARARRSPRRGSGSPPGRRDLKVEGEAGGRFRGERRRIPPGRGRQGGVPGFDQVLRLVLGQGRRRVRELGRKRSHHPAEGHRVIKMCVHRIGLGAKQVPDPAVDRAGRIAGTGRQFPVHQEILQLPEFRRGKWEEANKER